MGKIAPTLEVRVPTKYDEAWFRDLLLTLKRQHEEIARVINYQHGVDVAFLARKSVAQGPFSAETTINFATEDFDLQGDYDGTNKFTAPADGIYHLGVQVRLSGLNTNDVFALRMRRNGTIEFEDRITVLVGTMTIKLQGLLNLSFGDAITATVARTGGTGTASAIADPKFSFFYGRAEIIIP